MRIGHGFDIHRFELGKPLWLGGILIPFPKGMQAHSDGDVILHAICDALLGAMALGDIGRYFPDTDPQWKNLKSNFFLQKILNLMQQKQWCLQNLDITVIAEVPKLAPYIEAIATNIANEFSVNRNLINVKATTMEKLGPIGNQEAIAVHAVVLLALQTQATSQ